MKIQKVKAAEISYFDSNLLDDERVLSTDKRTPTEIWLDRIKTSVMVMRRDYQSN